jgi:hypothetical protein
LWITETISAGEIGFPGRDMGKGEDKNEFSRLVWSGVKFRSEWGKKIEDRWLPKIFTFFTSEIANDLSGHSSGGVLSRWLISHLVVFQRKSLLWLRVVKYLLNCSDLYFANWIFKSVMRWL